MSLNKCMYIGRIGRDIELSYSAGGVAIAKFSLAVDSGYGDKKETSWLPITCFQKTAENTAKFCKKGSKIYAECEVKTGSYDHKDGHKVYTTDFIANRIQFLGGGNDDVSKRSTVDAKNASKAVDLSSIDEISDDEIPF